MTVNTSTPRQVPGTVGKSLTLPLLTSNSRILFHRLAASPALQNDFRYGTLFRSALVPFT
jgi:hypothetical protein